MFFAVVITSCIYESVKDKRPVNQKINISIDPVEFFEYMGNRYPIELIGDVWLLEEVIYMNGYRVRLKYQAYSYDNYAQESELDSIIDIGCDHIRRQIKLTAERDSLNKRRKQHVDSVKNVYQEKECLLIN